MEGASTPDYPLQKKRHTFEYLRTISHLRPRTNTFEAVFRVRSLCAYAIHKFFQERDFVYVHTPLITGSDCEGAGEMFRVTTMDMENLPKNEDGTVDYTQDFFGKETSLTVSGQLNGETYAQAFRSNLQVEGTSLPFMILLDDSVYTMLQVQVAAGLAQGDKREKICSFLNDLNEQYRMLKFSADAAGNVLLTCCIPAGVPHFEPALVIAILNQIQGLLTATYPEIMKHLWEK